MKWLVVLVVVTVLLGLLAPQLSKLGLWRLPGDFRFKRGGREYFLPVTSTVLVSVALTLLVRLLGR
jgi:multisubunit Na+/H+ antiporter MnhG subunit